MVGPFIDRPWAVGLPLVGLSVLAVAAGLSGLYPELRTVSPGLSTAGLVFALIGSVAAVAMIGLAAYGFVAEVILGRNPSPPIQFFLNVARAMAFGFAFGLLAFGLAGWRPQLPSRRASRLLVGGGLVLFVPVALELLGFVADVKAPAWSVFLAMLLVAIDTVAVGYGLRSGGSAT